MRSSPYPPPPQHASRILRKITAIAPTLLPRQVEDDRRCGCGRSVEMRATGRTRDEHVKVGRMPRGRGRVLTISLIVLAMAAMTSGIALARTAAPSGSGVVIIKTTLGYQRAAATGTGMVLTSSRTILTNNHVIRGATRINVLVPETNR